MDSKLQSFISVFVIPFFFCCSLIHAQQPYIRKATTLCNSTDNSTSAFGYTCNGLTRSCQAYLTFRSQPPFDTVASISALMSADPGQLSQLNSVSGNETFETNRMVLVPVTCSCSGQYYQANTSYVTVHDDTYLVIANNTFQGLSTCQAMQSQNSLGTRYMYAGARVNVPLRCACPTKNQSDAGVRYLLSYLVTRGEFVAMISEKFGVNTGSTLQANEISEEEPTIYPFTTLLVPLQTPPLSSQVIDSSSPPPPPPPPSSSSPSPVPPSNNNSNRTWVYAVVGVLGGLTLLSIGGAVVFFLLFRKRKKEKDPISVIDSQSFEAIEKPLNKAPEEESEDFWESMSSIAQSLKVYKFDELKSATDDFSAGCWINGSVYRGSINGDIAAIKKMTGDVSKEINLLNKINHFNLIRLSGVCFNDGHWYLVYEYAVNGPLSGWIHRDNENQKHLTWAQRIQIALDVATGLNYLHSYTSPPHVHKDLKSSNVLLDGDFRAKLTNFGLARSANEQDGQFALTRHIVGTKGYMAPEYLENGLVSPKLDVYAFGVLMLEILTGKDVASLYEEVNVQISEILTPLLHEEKGKDNLSSFMDPSLQDKYPADLAMILVKLIDGCLMKDAMSRPDMGEIVQSLSRTMTATNSWELSVSISQYQSLR